jgi:hypothetical protein
MPGVRPDTPSILASNRFAAVGRAITEHPLGSPRSRSLHPAVLARGRSKTQHLPQARRDDVRSACTVPHTSPCSGARGHMWAGVPVPEGRGPYRVAKHPAIDRVGPRS